VPRDARNVAIGLKASLAASRVIEAQLWGVSAYDPVTLGGLWRYCWRQASWRAGSQ